MVPVNEAFNEPVGVENIVRKFKKSSKLVVFKGSVSCDFFNSCNLLKKKISVVTKFFLASY